MSKTLVASFSSFRQAVEPRKAYSERFPSFADARFHGLPVAESSCARLPEVSKSFRTRRPPCHNFIGLLSFQRGGHGGEGEHRAHPGSFLYGTPGFLRQLAALLRLRSAGFASACALQPTHPLSEYRSVASRLRNKPRLLQRSCCPRRASPRA